MSLENTTADDVSFNVSSRYLAYDVVGSGSEFRFDATVGSQPSVAAALYRPLGSTPFFVEPFAGVDKQTLNYIQDDHIVASYGQTRSAVGFDVGFNVGRLDDVRLPHAHGPARRERASRRPRAAGSAAARKRCSTCGGPTTGRTARSSRPAASVHGRPCSTS